MVRSLSGLESDDITTDTTVKDERVEYNTSRADAELPSEGSVPQTVTSTISTESVREVAYRRWVV